MISLLKSAEFLPGCQSGVAGASHNTVWHGGVLITVDIMSFDSFCFYIVSVEIC